jgi:hypothetical protein
MSSELKNGPHPGTATDAKRAESHALRCFCLDFVAIGNYALDEHHGKGEEMEATKIWDFRKRHDLTVAGLAEILGVHKSQVSRWETGQREPPPWLPKFLAALDKLKQLQA